MNHRIYFIAVMGKVKTNLHWNKDDFRHLLRTALELGNVTTSICAPA
jgi:hypothetical protein